MAETIIERAARAAKQALIADPETDAWMHRDDDPDDFRIDGTVRLTPVVRAVLQTLREIDDPLSPVLGAGKCTTGHWKAMIDAVLEGGASSQS